MNSPLLNPMLNKSVINHHHVDHNRPSNTNANGNATNSIIINCANNSTLQDLKIGEGSGVFTYHDSDDLTSVTSNRYIVWRTCDDILELNELSLNRDLHYNEFQIQFKNSLILQNGVTIQETPDKIIILVATIVSAHRLIFPHPNRLFSNPNSFGSLSCLAPTLSSANDSPCYSIFHNVSFDDFDANFVQLQNSFSQSSVLGSPAVSPYLATCSWLNNNLDAYFILSTTSGSLNIIKLPSPNSEESQSEIKVHTFDLRQNNLIGKLFNGIVPSIINKTSTGAGAAISLLPFHTTDDNWIFALCRDNRIRVISLKQQNILIEHSLINQMNSKESMIDSKTPLSSTQKPVSMKFWWYENETYFPNLVVYITDNQYNRFSFYQIIIPNSNSPVKNHSISFNSHQEPHLRYLFQRFIPSHYEMIDYFVHNGQLWAMWQHNETINLQYYSIDTNYEAEQPFEWIPVVADVNAHPEIGLRSPLVNPREYYINEIFWRGTFSLRTISKAITVLNRGFSDEKLTPTKIDLLIQKAVKLIDEIIRNQAENPSEMNVEEYIQHEIDAWNRLYQFCLDYHCTENEPMSIFVDCKTGIKGIVRKARLEFIPSLNPFDDMINYYFLHCKQNHSVQRYQNGDIRSNSIGIDHPDLFSISSFEYRLNTLMQPIQDSQTLNQNSDAFSTIENMKSSILALLHGMSAINVTLKDEDLLDFEAFMQRMCSCSTQTNLSLADITKQITEDSLLPEMPSLSDNSLVPLIDDFFEKCPYIVEAIKFFILRISYDFLTENEMNEGMNNEMQLFMASSNEEAQLKMQDALQFEITPIFKNLLSSRCGLDFTVTSITRILQMRYKFCRDLFLLQYTLTRFHSKVKNDYKSKIIQEVQAFMIPSTSQLLFALNHLNWICEALMITPNIWWTSESQPIHGLISFVNLNTSPSTTNTSNRGTSFQNSELLSVLEMKDFINLNRVGVLSHEAIFYDAYPHANILYFFIQFSGGIFSKRLLSYSLALEYNQGTLDQTSFSGDGIWSNLIPSYMNSICQLLWPFSSGQFKMAEFLLGVGQYHLVERYVDKLHPWCTIFSYSRYFAKGICYLMTGEGEKAITQFKQSVFGINSEPFLFKIFAQKPKSKDSQTAMIPNENGDSLEAENLLRKVHMRKHAETNMNLFLNARTTFRYYNKLIQLFNRYSTPDNVIELADCALKSLKNDSDPEYEQHYSALHSILFTCHLRLGNIKQAHLAMINNLDQEQRQNCLRQFIVNLCEKGKFEELVRYPYNGLEDNFVSILESKARSSGIIKNSNDIDDHRIVKNRKTILETETTIPTNYYHILYSYFLYTHNYRRAAQSIYDYYRQLNQEFNSDETMLRNQADALLMARNCLECLDDSKYSWIIKNSLLEIDRADKNRLKRKRGYFSDNQNDEYDQDKTVIEIVDVDELLREHELINARLKLLERNLKEYAIASTPLTANEVVILCISACLYEQAFKISSLFQLPLEPIFEGMASKYVQLLNGAFNRRRIDDEMMLVLLAESSFDGQPQQATTEPKLKLPIDNENFTVELFDVFYENSASNTECDFICFSSLSICDRMWYLIMYQLYQYETEPKVSTNYFKVVAEKLLSNGIMIPVSLLRLYRKCNCPELIRLLMTYNFLSEATQLSIDYMNAFMDYGVEYFDLTNRLYPKCEPLCIPLHLFDCLHRVLIEENRQQKQNETEYGPKFSGISITADYGFNDASAIDDETMTRSDTFIDYDSLIKDLVKTRQKLEETISACSKS